MEPKFFFFCLIRQKILARQWKVWEEAITQEWIIVLSCVPPSLISIQDWWNLDRLHMTASNGLNTSTESIAQNNQTRNKTFLGDRNGTSNFHELITNWYYDKSMTKFLDKIIF